MLSEEQSPTRENRLPGQDQKAEEEFRIEDDSQANWALKKIRQLKQKRQEKEELAQQEIEQIRKEIEMKLPPPPDPALNRLEKVEKIIAKAEGDTGE